MSVRVIVSVSVSVSVSASVSVSVSVCVCVCVCVDPLSLQYHQRPLLHEKWTSSTSVSELSQLKMNLVSFKCTLST